MKKNISIENCVKLVLSAFVLYLMLHFLPSVVGLGKRLLSASESVIAGFIIAYVVNIIMELYEKLFRARIFRKVRTGLALMLSYITVVLIVILLSEMIIPELVACITTLVSLIPEAVENFYLFIAQYANIDSDSLLNELLNYFTGSNWQNIATKILYWVNIGFDSAVTVVKSIFSLIIAAVLSIIMSVYVLSSKKQLRAQVEVLGKTYLKRSWFDKLKYVVHVIDRSFRSFITGQCIESVIFGVLCWLGMLIFRLPYAGMIGALSGFLQLIPIAGAWIGAGIGALMILTISPLKALLFLIFIIVLQQLESNLIYPHVVGNNVGLPALWVLASITVFGSLFGLVGMMIGVPITAAVYTLIRNDIAKRSSPTGELPDYEAHTVKTIGDSISELFQKLRHKDAADEAKAADAENADSAAAAKAEADKNGDDGES